ncbi:pyruvate formate-lyase 1-activating enzyme [Atopobium minutum]|nr:pyruvate formate-lyase 1-activating enzyme [Atopobium minutum]
MVVFMQGCPMRCAYCHNPDSWKIGAGTQTTVKELLKTFERNRPFYRSGGLTVSGGEPLVQAGFVADLFEAAHKAPAGRIHTCLDSSGSSFNPHNKQHYQEISRLLDHCDMVLLDIKHSDPVGHQELCGLPQTDPLAFGNELARRKIPVIIRHVVVPGITDTDEELAGIGRIIAQWDNVVGLDVLPYHTMGKTKYQQLGIPYKLEGVPAMDPVRVPEIRQKILRERARVRAGRASHQA